MLFRSRSGGADLGLWQWSRNGILFEDGSEETDLLLLEDGQEEPVVVAGGSGNQSQGQFSHDGKWLAYASDENGETEVYVRGYQSTGTPILISGAGSDMPRWRADDGELFFRRSDGWLMSVAIDQAAGDIFRHEPPVPLFPGIPGLINALGTINYQPSRDGQRFLVGRPAGTKPPIIVLLNWLEAIGR